MSLDYYTRVTKLLLRLKLRILNGVKTNRALSMVASAILVRMSPVLPACSLKLKVLDLYLRYNYGSSFSKKVLRGASRLTQQLYESKSISLGGETAVIRSIILKRFVDEKEKGILLVSFESELMKLASCSAFNDLEKMYQIIFLPTWHPFYCIPFYLLLGKAKEPFWVMPSSLGDMKLCADVGGQCMPLPFQSSSWVDGDSFPESAVNRDIDIIMLANFSEYKRHWLLFEALCDLPPELKVVIAGRPLANRTREVLLAEAECFDVADRFQFIENPSNELIVDLLSRSRLFCALSYKEGSYVAIAEALFAGTPVGIYENAIVGSKDYINPETGILFKCNVALSDQILAALQHVDEVRPAEWARANMSASVNCDKLNTLLKEHSKANSHSWSSDIAPFFCRNFDFIYYGDEADFTAEYVSIRETFGIEIVRKQADS